MSAAPTIPRELVLLVPDCNYESGLSELLRRVDSLAIRRISFDIYVHMHRDPGCLLEAHEFLRPFTRDFGHALVLFDREGCGRSESVAQLEDEVQARLDVAGWRGRSRVLAVDPEFDAWVWSDSPHVERVLGWPSGQLPLRDWLRQCDLLDRGQTKPSRPKEALEQVLRKTGRPRSASTYAQLGRQVSVQRCADPAFQELRNVLQQWFPPVSSGSGA